MPIIRDHASIILTKDAARRAANRLIQLDVIVGLRRKVRILEAIVKIVVSNLAEFDTSFAGSRYLRVRRDAVEARKKLERMRLTKREVKEYNIKLYIPDWK